MADITKEEFVKVLIPHLIATTRRTLGVTVDTFKKNNTVDLNVFLEAILTDLYKLAEPDPTEDSTLEEQCTLEQKSL